MIKAVLFDLDDTLFDAEGAYRKAEMEALKFLNNKFNKIITKKRFFEVYSEAKEEIHKELHNTASSHNRWLYFQRFTEKMGLTLKPKMLEDIAELYWKTVLKNCKPFSGVKRTFKIIKANHLQIAIVSDLLADIQIRKLEAIGLAEYVDFLISSEEASVEKPSKKIFRLALKKLNCKPSEVIMVGDNPEKDIVGAKKLGIKTVLVKSFREKPKRKIYNYYIEQMPELIKLLKLKTEFKKEHKVIVFDMMGVLFKEGHIVSKIFHPMLRKVKPKLTYKKLKKHYEDYTIGKISRKTFWKRIGFNKIPTKLEKEFLDKLKIDEDFIKIVKKSKRKYIFAILSNISKEWGDYLRKKHNLDKIFRAIVYSGYYKMRKPNKKLYQKLISNLSETIPENYYFIDDDLKNLRAGKNLMMKTVWFKRENTVIVYIPDYVITSFNDLKKVIK